MQGNTYEQSYGCVNDHLLEHNNFRIKLKQLNKDIIIQIKDILQQTKDNILLEGRITDQMLEKCMVDNLEQFAEYIRQPSHVKINLAQNKISIMAVTTFRDKKNYIQLLSIQLTQTTIKLSQKQQLDRILMLCSNKADLTSKQLKESFKTIISYIQLLNGSNISDHNKKEEQQNETIDSIISKTMKLGNQQQVIQLKFVNLKSEIDQIKQKIANYLQVHNQYTQNIQKQLLINKNYNENKIKQINYSFQLNIKDIKSEIKRIKQQSQFYIKQVNNKSQSKKQEIKKQESLSILFQFYFKIPLQEKLNFKIQDNQIKRIRSRGENQKCHIGIIGNIPISQQNIFTIRVVREQSQGVSVGVVDLNSFNEVKNAYDNAIYYGGNGWIQNAGQFNVGNDSGLKSGYIVKVIVDIKQGIIRWEVSSEKDRYEFKNACKNLKLKNRSSWVPYIRIINEDEIVELL